MYTIEQIIEILQALNATDNTNAYASKFASSGSAYASQITNSGSPLLVYIPSATALAAVIAIIVYCYRASSERQATARKILERKQTGFFSPKRSSTPTAKSPTRKLSAVECLQIMEVLAKASDDMTTLEEENGEYHSDEELPEGFAEAVLEQHFGEGISLGSKNSSASSLSVSVDSNEDVRKDWGYDSESTPTNRGSTNPEQSEDGTQRTLSDTVNASSQDDVVAESGEGSQGLLELERASIVSDDEEYTRRIGRSDSPDSFATANVPYDPPRPRRASWNGDDNSKHPIPARAEFETGLRARSPQRTETSGENVFIGTSIPSFLFGSHAANQHRATTKTPSRKPIKAPTFQPDGVIPPRRTSTKKSEVSATQPESSKAPGFTHGMIQAMAQYAAQSKEEGESLVHEHRRPRRTYRRYKGTRRI